MDLSRPFRHIIQFRILAVESPGLNQAASEVDGGDSGGLVGCGPYCTIN